MDGADDPVLDSVPRCLGDGILAANPVVWQGARGLRVSSRQMRVVDEGVVALKFLLGYTDKSASNELTMTSGLQ